MFDVGQGDAFLLRSEGRAVLIDTGAYDSLLRSALARQGVVHLDAVIVTHADDDHCGALASLRGTVAVDSVIVAEDALSCGCASCRSLVDDAVRLVGRNRLMGIERGDEIAVGSFTLKTVWPEGFVEEGGNADSLCFVVGCDADADGEADSTALMVGDAEAEQLASMMDEGLLPPAGADILKVGHHGSKNAFDDELLEELAPRIALISVGGGKPLRPSRRGDHGRPRPQRSGDVPHRSPRRRFVQIRGRLRHRLDAAVESQHGITDFQRRSSSGLRRRGR